jgi:hypothetical protein
VDELKSHNGVKMMGFFLALLLVGLVNPSKDIVLRFIIEYIVAEWVLFGPIFI